MIKTFCLIRYWLKWQHYLHYNELPKSTTELGYSRAKKPGKRDANETETQTKLNALNFNEMNQKFGTTPAASGFRFTPASQCITSLLLLSSKIVEICWQFKFLLIGF